MSILSGFLKTKKYRKKDDGNYQLQSEWTSSETVEMGDGNTLETNLGSIKGITSSLSSTSSNYALSASAGKSLQDQTTTNTNSINTLNTKLTKNYYNKTDIDTKLGYLMMHKTAELKAGRSIYVYPKRINGYKLISATTNNEACYVKWFSLGEAADTIELSAVPEKDSMLYLTYTPLLY